VEDRGGRDVDALGDLGVLVAEQLHAEQPPGGPVAGDPHGDAVAAGVVGLVVIAANIVGTWIAPTGLTRVEITTPAAKRGCAVGKTDAAAATTGRSGLCAVQR